MSTQIKNTLFRFVTMRTPELLEKEIVNQKFVKHPESEKEATATFESSFLAIAAKSDSTYKNLVEIAKRFEPTAIKKREDLVNNKFVSKEFYDFAVWLTANRSALDTETVKSKIKISPKGPSLVSFSNDEKRKIAWENLLYQIITHKSNYVREAILSLLVADFFIQNYNHTETNNEVYRKLAQARVIIPNLFMNKLTEKKQQTTTVSPTLQNTQNELAKKQEAQIALNQVADLNTMIQEVNRAQNLYNKRTQQAYNDASKKYDLEKEAIISKAYEAFLVHQSTQNKQAQATAKSSGSPVDTTPADTNVTQPLFEPPYVKPFTFEKQAELNWNLLQQQLSPETFAQVQSLTQNYAYDTFNEVLQNWQEQITTIQENIPTVSLPQENVLVNIGGVYLPVGSTQATDYAFSVVNNNRVSGEKSSLNILLNNNFNNQNIISATYELSYNSTNKVTGTSFEYQGIGSGSINIFLETIKILKLSYFDIKGTFTLSDGRKIDFNGTGTIDTKIYYPNREIYYLQGKGTYTITDKNSTGSSPVDYIPPTFGVKRLGIADYRKVEQEICCYVPGEVSHIENIMASEYKERATRSLQRREETNSSTTERETEKLTDTTTSNRFEMNQEVNSVLAEDTHVGMNTNFNSSWGGTTGTDPKFGLNIGADFATNTSKEESNHQAVTMAKEVTERALDRIVQKVKEERIVKITNEFEETNTHGFDNRKNANHISGVYRWIDKVYRNTIVNYGKRLMYEFMIPEPGTFHNIASVINTGTGEKLVKPIDPRTYMDDSNTLIKLNLKDFSFVDENTAKYWAGKYNAIVQPMPEKTIKIGKSYAFNNDKVNITNSQKDNIQIPEKYTSQYVNLKYQTSIAGGYLNNDFALMVGNVRHIDIINNSNNKLPLLGFSNNVPVSISFIDYYIVSINVEIECTLTEEAKTDWQIKTFNAIIQAYEAKLEEYNQKLKQLRTEVRGTNPGFYRQYENTVLRKNCIEYLISHEAIGDTKLKLVSGTTIMDTQVNSTNANLESYAAKAKFFEQAFEWNLMSYNFYPFYWADKNKWSDLYNVSEFNDPLFRAFLQSGMARVVVTVRPGFEEAVNWYMATGQIWNGGQVPTIDDPLYISIVDELREIGGTVEETWETRVPTSLTILQAGSAGFEAKQALPCDEDCKDNILFDSDGKVYNPFKILPIAIPVDSKTTSSTSSTISTPLNPTTENTINIKS